MPSPNIWRVVISSMRAPGPRRHPSPSPRPPQRRRRERSGSRRMVVGALARRGYNETLEQAELICMRWSPHPRSPA